MRIFIDFKQSSSVKYLVLRIAAIIFASLVFYNIGIKKAVFSLLDFALIFGILSTYLNFRGTIDSK